MSALSNWFRLEERTTGLGYRKRVVTIQFPNLKIWPLLLALGLLGVAFILQEPLQKWLSPKPIPAPPQTVNNIAIQSNSGDVASLPPSPPPPPPRKPAKPKCCKAPAPAPPAAASPCPPVPEVKQP